MTGNPRARGALRMILFSLLAPAFAVAGGGLISGCGMLLKGYSNSESHSRTQEIELEDGSIARYRELEPVSFRSEAYRRFSGFFLPLWQAEQKDALEKYGPINGEEPRIEGRLPLYFLAPSCRGRPLYLFHYRELRLAGEEPHPDYRFSGNAGMPVMIYAYDRKHRRFTTLFDEEVLDLIGVETAQDNVSASRCPALVVRVHGSVLGREGVESGNCRVSFDSKSGKYAFPDTPPDADRETL